MDREQGDHPLGWEERIRERVMRTKAKRVRGAKALGQASMPTRGKRRKREGEHREGITERHGKRYATSSRYMRAEPFPILCRILSKWRQRSRRQGDVKRKDTCIENGSRRLNKRLLQMATWSRRASG